MTEPLFDLIDRQGNPELLPSKKVKVVFTPQKLLKELRIIDSLCDEIGRTSYKLRPLNALILARRPDKDERSWFEGRGAYHTDIPIENDLTATVYVKGSGNERAFDQATGEFTGFPSQPDRLFFDELALSEHPRELGTETVRWALMEAVNATFIFAHVAKKQGWEHISEAVRAGVTIPLNVMHQKELSAYLYQLLQQHRETNQDVLDRKAMEWEGNTQLGSISLIVPNHKRIAGGIEEAEERNELIGRLSNPDVARTAGRTLRTLADMGLCYSVRSSHGQNLYYDGLMAQADNSDLVTLGDYQGTRINRNYDEGGKPIYYDISPQDQRVALMFYQLDRQSLLTPLHHPLMNPESRITWEQVVDNQKAFWEEMLSGVADPTAIRQMVRLLPFMRAEINMAAAPLLTESADQSTWVSMARKKRDVLRKYENEYGVLTEYDRKIKANLVDESEPYLIKQLMEQGKLKARLVAQCLESGNLKPFEAYPILGKALALSKTIEQIQDSNNRDEILALCAHCFSSRGRVYHFLQNADLVKRFEGQHYDLLARLINDGRYEDAKCVLKTLVASQDNEISSYYPLGGGYEVGEDRYPRLLLEADANYQKIYDRARYDLYLTSFARRTHPFSLMGVFREIMNKGEVAPQSLSVLEYSKDHQLPSPASVIRTILGSFEENSAVRQQLTEWLEKYLLKLGEQEVLDERFGEQGVAILDDLEVMVKEIQDTYPELAFAHQGIFAPALFEANPERARTYFEQAKIYYNTTLSERKKLINVDLDKLERSNRNDPEYYHTNISIAAEFEKLGFPIIARDYRKKARGEYLAALW